MAIYALVMALLSACKRRWVLWTPYLVGPVLWYGLVKSELPTDWTTTEQGLAAFCVSAAAYAVVMLATKPVSHYKQNATAKRAPHHKQNATTKRAQDAATQADLSADDWRRHRVSVALRTVLMGCALLLAFAVIDTLGRSIYVAAVHDPGVVLGVSGSLLTFLWTAATFARRVVVRFASTTGGKKRPGTGLGLTAWVAAIVLVATVLTGAALGAQAIVWQGCGPIRGPSFESEEMRHTSVLDESNPAGVEFLVRYPSQKDEENTSEDACDSKEAAGERRRLAGKMLTVWDDDDGPFGNELSHTLWMMLAALGASIVLGSSRVFLNRSSHLPLYSARLTRAYLGASNRRRFVADDESDEGKPQPDAATRVIACDDIGASEYWGWGWDGGDPAPASAHWVNGGPLHIVNVTINETVDGRSQIQQNDRKGLGLAIGPCGLSAGKRHHLLPGAAPARKPVEEQAQPGGHYVFRFDRYWRPAFLRPPSYPAEELSLGQWMSISGAAFSTGLGSRTNQGLSLLAGMTNIRLGYWWRPGIAWRLSLKRVFGSLFWVQTYLFREMLARFPGTQNALWYLSDGGHFENMGGYELIRRRLPFIVIIDAEADSKYQFEGLGNLVRKARIDFGAEIEFLPDPLGLLQEPGLPVGPLSHLRRGKWEGNGQDRTFEAVDAGGHSIAHAALATVRYDGKKGDPNRPSHLLLYIKPTLLESRPADMDHYAAENGDFPHQSTGDQFFDEAQWESYRKLGEMIGERLFPSTDGEARGPLPDAFRGTLPTNDSLRVRRSAEGQQAADERA